MTAFPNPAYDGEVYIIGTRSWTYSLAQDAWRLNKNGPTGPMGPQGETGPAGVLLTSLTVDTFVGDGITTSFELSITPVSIYNMVVNVDGLVQTANVNFTLSLNNIVFTTAPIENSTIDVMHFLTGSAITGPVGYTGPTGPHGGPPGPTGYTGPAGGPTGPTGPGVNGTTFQNIITFTATINDPEVTFVNQQCSYDIVGDKISIQYNIAWSSSSNIGLGDYLITLPTGIMFNTIINPIYTGTIWSPTVADMSQYLIPVSGGYAFDNNWNRIGYIIPYTTTKFRFIADNNVINGFNALSSSWINTANAPMFINIKFEISV